MYLIVIILLMALSLGGCAGPADVMSNVREDFGISQSEEGTGESSQGLGEKTPVSYDDHFLVSGTKYAYGTLSSEQKLWYDDVEHILGSMAKEGELATEGIVRGLTEKDIDYVFSCVCMDHPELFYVEGYSYVTHMLGDQIVGYVFSGSYSMDREEALRREREILSVAAEIWAGFLSSGADDYAKIKYVYETLIKRTEYDLDAPDNQTIYSALVGGRSVCQGYAKSMQYLLNGMGVECTLVQGVAMGQPHGWNLVKSDGEYYYVDVTWGDNSYHPGETGDNGPEILYDYLLVTTAEIEMEHLIDMEVPLPFCTSMDDSYFLRENAYFTKADEAGLRALFQMASPEDSYQVSIKCASYECFNDIKKLLLDKNKIFEYYPAGRTQISYYQNEELLCLTFWVTN